MMSVVGLVERCQWLHLLLDLLSGADVSAVGTILLQSPGWNEGKAQGGMRAKPDMKPWEYVDKTEKSSDEERHLPTHANAPTDKYNATNILWFVPPLKGLNKCVSMINPGLAPWAMQEYRPKGLIYIFTTNQFLCCFDLLAQKTTTI